MKCVGGLWTAVLLYMLFSLPVLAQRPVRDSVGRAVMLPERVERVFASGPPASIFLYILAPDRLLGWPRAPQADERPFLLPPYDDLPELGRLAGRGDTANLEVVLSRRPDLIFDVGSLAQTYASLAERVQQQTGIPYLLIDGSFTNSAASLRLLGGILGVEERAEQLARYTEQTLSELDAGLARIPQEQRPRVYFARGPDGLETGVKGSINTEIIERVGAHNVAVSGARSGLSGVSMEQVLRWNPDTIITLDDRFFAKVKTDPLWSRVDAVQRGRVYLAPRLPFGWVDRPPSLNRVIGLRWLAELFYPEVFDADVRALTREFYRLFYHIDLDEAQLDTLLAGAK